jgi:hypothetical protein
MLMRARARRFLPYAVVGLVVLLVGIQFVPNSRPAPDPAIRREPNWDSPRTRELAVRACFDCHSNQPEYPWYSYVAPVSWLVVGDVKDARSKLNFSEWDLPQREATSATKEINKGDMPLPIYLLLHPEARLSEAEKAELVQGLDATIAGDRPRRR